jgi:CheY-like chemotaxis protein
MIGLPMNNYETQVRGKILLIDDDHDMVAIGEQVFVKAGFDFISAHSAENGLKMILSEVPDLVILDYLLPDMKGEELIKVVSSDEAYKDVRAIPFVILTAWDEELGRLSYLYENGLWAYLTKPFGHRELRCVIENIIQRDRAQKKGVEPITVVDVPEQWPDDESSDLLYSILGLSKMLVGGMDGEIAERYRIDLRAIFNAAKKLVNKIDNRQVQVLRESDMIGQD